mgnify:CR=1 FL=1
MFSLGKSKKKKGEVVVRPKFRFEEPHSQHNSEWRRPQGIYANDVDAKKRLDNLYRKALVVSQILSLILMLIVFFGMSYMLLFGNFENVILDDGSRLFCTIMADGSVGIAF